MPRPTIKLSQLRKDVRWLVDNMRELNKQYQAEHPDYRSEVTEECYQKMYEELLNLLKQYAAKQFDITED